MRRTVLALAVSLALARRGVCQDGVLSLRGIGAEGKTKYSGGTVEFLDVSLADQLVHLAATDRVPLRLSIRYRVVEAAPVLLNSRFGTEYWHLFHYGRNEKTGFHTREQIDLSKPGEAQATVAEAWHARGRGPQFRKGLVGIRGHHYFLVDQPNGEWLDVVRPPGFFQRPELRRTLAFTLANLREFSLAVGAVESTWEPAGRFRLELLVTDADGDRFRVVNAQGTAEAGDWTAALETEMDHLERPTGWLATCLPDTPVPDEVHVSLSVRAMTPSGPATRIVTKVVAAGHGRKTEAEMSPSRHESELPRNARGTIRETRALWLNPRSFTTRRDIETVVERASKAGINAILADVFVRSMFMATSDLFPTYTAVEEGLDPLGGLIDACHRRGIEVHPWFCVTYRDRAFRERLGGIDIVDLKGAVAPLGADVHRPKYRDFMVGLMTGVARDYDVDGVHLDYIRSMSPCYCPACRTEFSKAFGKPLTEADDEDWIVWQRQAIGEIVERTADAVRGEKPGAIMSAAVFSLTAGAQQGQDPAGWVRKGWLDVVVPMDYAMDTMAVATNEQAFLDAIDDDGRLVTGLSLYRRVDGEPVARPAALVKQQIETVRDMGIHGYCLFEYRYLTDELTTVLRTAVNREEAVPYFR